MLMILLLIFYIFRYVCIIVDGIIFVWLWILMVGNLYVIFSVYEVVSWEDSEYVGDVFLVG